MAVGRSPCSPPPSPFLPIGLCINRLSRHFCAAPPDPYPLQHQNGCLPVRVRRTCTAEALFANFRCG